MYKLQGCTDVGESLDGVAKVAKFPKAASLGQSQTRRTALREAVKSTTQV